MPAPTELAARLAELECKGLTRRRRILEGGQGACVRVDGHELLSFASNDYLGLANHPELVVAAQLAAARHGVGAGASHLLTGHHALHHRLEEALAAFVGLPAALLFSTGYMANLGVVSALLGHHDAIFADRLNHASLVDAALLSRARHIRYPHLDLDALDRRITETDARVKLIATDAVFSMDGDLAPVPELLALAERHGAWLYLDDAHGFGVLGRQGRGILEHFSASPIPPNLIYMATLGKAAGVCGAFVAGSPELIEWLIQKARTYVYTTAMPPLLAATTARSLELIRSEDWRRERLARLIARLRAGAERLPWRLLPSQTPIQPLLVGSNEEALRLAEGLRQRGILIPAIRPPTVPEGTARLRISLSAAHTDDDVERLLSALAELGAQASANAVHPLAAEDRTPLQVGEQGSDSTAHTLPQAPSPPPRGEGPGERATPPPPRGEGSGERVRGQGAIPTVFLHGWGLHGGIWADVVERLAGRPLLTPDLPGHGFAPPVTPYTLDALADRLAQAMPAACVAVGWSLGGMVALTWAARHPEQVRALVLVGSTPVFVNRDDWSHGMKPEVLAGFAQDLSRDYRATLLRFLALQARGSEAARSVIGYLRARLLERGEPDPAILAAGLKLLRGVDLRQQVKGVRCPTLIVHGEQDVLCPVEAARWLAGHLPRARLALHERASHAPFLSHPEWFASTLADFLSELPCKSAQADSRRSPLPRGEG